MKLILSVIFSLLIITLHAQEQYVVKVRMKNPKKYPVLIVYSIDDKYLRDTSDIMEGGYLVFKGTIPSIQKVTLIVRNPDGNINLDGGFIPQPSFSFLLRNGADVTIEGDAERPWMASLKSTDKELAQYEVFCAKDKVFIDKSWSLTKRSYADTANVKLQKEMEEQQKLIGAGKEKWEKEFVNKYPGSYAALEVFSSYSYELSVDELEKQFGALSSTYKSTPLGKMLSDRIEAASSTRVGKKATAISQQGIDGTLVDINSLKGKYVLIDFWGSWCGPCRQSHPHLKTLYDTYKGLGFEIIGVASENGTSEQQKKVWRDAVKADNMNWLQVLNDPAQSDLVKAYGIAAFPTKVLLDKEGTIILRYTGGEGEELDAKLKQVLGK